MSLSLKPWLLANSMAGSSQNLASFSAFITWICLRSSSLEYILKTYPFSSLNFGLIGLNLLFAKIKTIRVKNK